MSGAGSAATDKLYAVAVQYVPGGGCDGLLLSGGFNAAPGFIIIQFDTSSPRKIRVEFDIPILGGAALRVFRSAWTDIDSCFPNITLANTDDACLSQIECEDIAHKSAGYGGTCSIEWCACDCVTGAYKCRTVWKYDRRTGLVTLANKACRYTYTSPSPVGIPWTQITPWVSLMTQWGAGCDPLGAGCAAVPPPPPKYKCHSVAYEYYDCADPGAGWVLDSDLSFVECADQGSQPDDSGWVDVDPAGSRKYRNQEIYSGACVDDGGCTITIPGLSTDVPDGCPACPESCASCSCEVIRFTLHRTGRDDIVTDFIKTDGVPGDGCFWGAGALGNIVCVIQNSGADVFPGQACWQLTYSDPVDGFFSSIFLVPVADYPCPPTGDPSVWTNDGVRGPDVTLVDIICAD